MKAGEPDAAGEVTADCFQLASRQTKPGSRLEEIQEEAEAIMRQSSFPLSRLTSQRMTGGGGQEGKAAGSELSSQHSNKQEGKRLSNQL